MEKLRRAALPALVALILLAALASRLASCSADLARGSETTVGGAFSPSASPSPAQSPSPPGARPTAACTDDDIANIFRDKGFEVREIRHADGLTAVRYYSPNAPKLSSFAWFDRATGDIDVVAENLLVDEYEIAADKKLYVLTTGESNTDGRQWFPEIYSSYAFGGNTGMEMEHFYRLEPYYMPIGKSFTVGYSCPACVRNLTLDFDSVSVGFVPQPDHEQEFEVPYRSIPKTSVVNTGGYSYVTFYDTVLSPDFRAPRRGAGDGLRTFVSIRCDGKNTLLTLKLGEKAERYNVTMEYSPDDGMPYAVIRYRGNDVATTYPAGW